MQLRNAASAAGFALLLAATQLAVAEMDCLYCHRTMTKKKVVHAAVHMGCPSCHDNLDVSRVPHLNKGPFAKGLRAEVPALCISCHEQALFEGNMVHAPVNTGLCLDCHNPHTSNYPGLLNMKPASLCLNCHSDIENSEHLISGLSTKGHPLGNSKEVAPDPKRPGKMFYCASCHEPHRSTLPKLTRYGDGMTSCQTCHDK
ncbi:MAG: cytochrome c3 family protein [Rhodoferax sp.]|nr:cytochrome c3 family protein [Rhodoferax sp.]